MKISLVVNCDNRPERNEFGGNNLTGVVNTDFLTAGIWNKRNFLKEFDKETIVYVDVHNEIPYVELADTVVFRKHTDGNNFNDWNYIRALSLADGDIIIHADQDTCMFARNQDCVEGFISLIDLYDFVSYPSHWSPLPVSDNSFDHTWVSTRFFMCRRESLDMPEIIKCARDYDYWCNTYPVNRKCPWLEHWIGSIAKYRNQKIYYPPINLDDIAIFSWGSYKKGTLQYLNNIPYEEVKQFILNNGGVQYPCDINMA